MHIERSAVANKKSTDGKIKQDLGQAWKMSRYLNKMNRNKRKHRFFTVDR